MNHKIVFASLVLFVISSVFGPATCRNAVGQTVGDTFIDTSEWVQSTSPIKDGYSTNGYITETIVRGYRGPGYDRYYNAANAQTAIEFSAETKIQPIVYEKSDSTNTTSLEPLRPTPDPVIQAANHQANSNSASTYAPQLRGFASQANFENTVQPVGSMPAVQDAPRNVIQTGFSPPATRATGVYSNDSAFNGSQPAMYTSAPYSNYPPSGFSHNPSANYGYAPPATNSYPPQPQVVPASYTPVMAYNTNPPTGNQYAPAPVAYTSTLRNCCDPVYAQTQFVTPNVNPGPGTLRTYPQYNNNPYPNRGFGISQPYTRDTWAPMIPLRSMPYGTYLGQGIIGQPVAYVDGEPVRNFLRYVFP